MKLIFLRKVLQASDGRVPGVINVDNNPAHGAAMIVEQGHRTVKKRTWLAKGYGSLQTAWRTLQGTEAVHMIRKGRVRWAVKGDAREQARFIEQLFGIAA